MNYKMIGRFNALILGVEAVFMLPSAVIALVLGEHTAFRAFLYSILIILAFAGLLALLSRGARSAFYAKEGLTCVASGWVLMSLLGCLPFYFSGEFPSFIDCLFETVSGFTTTGASILSEVESLSRSVVFWRSFSHWLGGMGVLVLLLALLPGSGKNAGFTVYLLRAESPGPDVGKLMPKMRQTAAVLYLTYIALTVLNAVFLLAGGMPVFDAVCTAFGTAGTGGFATRNDSMMSFSPYLQNVCTVFMLLFGINFSCYYFLLLRRFRAVFCDEELRLYAGLVLGSTILITCNIRPLYATLGESIRHSAFQVASVITTTGFATADYDLWPTFSKALLMFLMFIGACAGSTGGGFKCMRVLILFKSLKRNIVRLLHPQRVETVRINHSPMDEGIIANTNAYLSAYVIILCVSTIVVCIDPFAETFTTGFSAVVACFNNIGPGFDAVGATGNFGGFTPFSKLVLILDMLAGRLEIFPLLILFSRHAWKSK